MTAAGTIVLRHMGYLGIEPEATRAVLPQAALLGDRQDVELDQRELVAQARATRDWAQAYRATRRDFEARLKPLLGKHPEHRVAYFGTVPIPLAMLVGMQVGTWRAVDAYQHHHVRKDWAWTAPHGEAPAIHLDIGELPGRTSLGEGEVVLRVSVSYAVDTRLTRAVVAAPLADLHLSLDPVQTDLEAPAALDAIARRFREALDLIQDRLPRTRRIHVFASVPVGVAFRMGTTISPTMHAPIQTYELDRAGLDRGYYPAFVLQGAPVMVQTPTPVEATQLAHERGRWQAELDRIKRLAADLGSTSDGWLVDVGANAEARVGRAWRTMPRLGSLRALTARIDLDSRREDDSFRLDPGAACWRLDDGFLLSIIRRLDDEHERQRAARIFLLHELVHQDQCLTRSTSAQIGRFGKVLEEADYQADVWSFLHEYRLARADAEVADPSRFFRDVVRVATEVMMAFDVAGGSSDEMQARRISRYLIWSWQALVLERATTFEECVAILLEKPVIELAGLDMFTRDRRLFCKLRVDSAHDLEIAVLRGAQLFRHACGPAAPLDRMLDALRDHDPGALREGLRGVADQVLAAR